MKIRKVLLVSHVYYTVSGPVYGPVDVIKNYLVSKKIKFVLIKYPLSSGWLLPIKSLMEIVTTIFRALVYRPDVFIGIDPLNALPGVWLRKTGLLNKIIFYCVDFTPTRFKNKLLNSAYLWIDKYCAINSDEVWNVSGRIVDYRKKQGVDASKVKLVPNSPSFKDCPRRKVGDIDRNRIVMVSGLTHSPALDLVLESFRKIHSEFPKVQLVIIGTGSYQNKLERKIKDAGLDKSVILTGQLSNKKLLGEVSRSGLALAIYSRSKEYSWVYYGDSKKAREYFACGVPVVITDVVATSEDVKKYEAGIVARPVKAEVTSAIEKFLKSESFWFSRRKNAIKLARDFDITKILDSNLGLLV